MTKNHWLRDKIVAKGYDFWTFEINDIKGDLVPEAIVILDESPEFKVIEKLEVNGIWKPAFIVWEKFTATYTDQRFIENHSQIRLLEVEGDADGILRHYDKSGERLETWLMYGLCLTDIDFPDKAVKAEFIFNHVRYFDILKYMGYQV